MALESFFAGAVGWISVVGNIAPKLATDIYTYSQTGEYDKAWEAYHKVLPMCKFLEGSGKYIQIVKRVMDLQGLAGGPARLPRLGLSDEEDSKLQALLKDLEA